jgi:hypothetical protein
MTRQNTNANSEDEQLEAIDEQLISEAPSENINSWLVDSPIEHCPICFDHRRCGNDCKNICTADPARPDCPMIAE